MRSIFAGQNPHNLFSVPHCTILIGEACDTDKGVDLPGADELLASEEIPASKDILASMQTIARSLHTNTNTLGDLPHSIHRAMD